MTSPSGPGNRIGDDDLIVFVLCVPLLLGAAAGVVASASRSAVTWLLEHHILVSAKNPG